MTDNEENLINNGGHVSLSMELEQESLPTMTMAIDPDDSVSADKAEAYAVGEREGVPVGPTDPAYHNNAKYYAEQAAESAEALETAQEVIDGYEADSEAYAVGKRDGTDVESTDPAYHNNSKYYAEQAGDSASDAEAFGAGTRDGVNVASTDPAYQNNAKYYAEQAAQSAQQASTESLYKALKAVGLVVYSDAFYIDPDAMPAAT